MPFNHKQIFSIKDLFFQVFRFIDHWLFPIATFLIFCLSHTLYFFSIIKFLFVYKVLRDFKSFRSPYFFILSFCVLLPGIYGTLLGFQNHNLGVAYESRLYILAFLMFLVLFWRDTKNSISNIFIMSEVSGWVIVLTTFCYFWAPDLLLFFGFDFEYFRFFIQPFQGYLKFNSIQVTALIFITPMVLVSLLYNQKWRHLFLSVFLTTLVLISGRRSFVLLVISLLLVLFLFMLIKRRQYLKSLIFLVIPVMSVLLVMFPMNFRVTSYKNMVTGAFDFNAIEVTDFNALSPEEKTLYSKYLNLLNGENLCVVNPLLNEHAYGADVRKKQFMIGLSTIKKSPVFGHGLGYVIPNCIRSETAPWRLELSYVEIAIAVGIFGFLTYLLFYGLTLYKQLVSFKTRPQEISIMIGSICFLICSMTNPYIVSTTFIWIFFLPYLILNQKR